MPLAHKVCDLTGPGITDRFGVGGTDLGATVRAPDGRLVSVFGDTFEVAGVGGPGWRSPVVLFADPATVDTGLVWTGCAGEDGYAQQVVGYRHRGLRRMGTSMLSLRRISTVLPTDVITLGDDVWLHVMACRELGHPRATELHRSRDSGDTWEPAEVRWPGDHHGGLFQMLTWETDGTWVYAFTTGFQRAHGLLLHRVPVDRLDDPTAWEGWGWDGATWDWGRPPTEVLPGAHGELSLRRVPDATGREWWLLVVFDAGNYRIDALLLDHPTANLHTAPRTTVVAGAGWGDEDHAGGRVAQLYGGYTVPGSTLDDLHLVVSQWNTGTNWPYRSMQFRVDVSELVPTS
ncbi:DUF4185 domain-containing protein [Actinomycetospora sp. NBRC 106378]|uniref:DUF4185 domain-containing protein n=1 Tax=Actinomycetospora sp. NBRC 106378 TaxID=3032208 RepID=UPI0024A2EF55|nr:DUF4185 domain-containing protein [Actinomycetospora sp. NBRC 106378]GLZ56136.1 hypothetical protein Acsp07_57530 [Actinomycetospora sp. NBRC 106378]